MAKIFNFFLINFFFKKNIIKTAEIMINVIFIIFYCFISNLIFKLFLKLRKFIKKNLLKKNNNNLIFHLTLLNISIIIFLMNFLFFILSYFPFTIFKFFLFILFFLFYILFLKFYKNFFNFLYYFIIFFCCIIFFFYFFIIFKFFKNV